MKKTVLILCTGNSARSQMAEGLLRHDAGDRFEVSSAGTRPSPIRPEAIQVMQEIGVDISGHRSKSVDEFATRDFDSVLTHTDSPQLRRPRSHGRLERRAAGRVPANPGSNSRVSERIPSVLMCVHNVQCLL
jgi:arsenate reductase